MTYPCLVLIDADAILRPGELPQNVNRVSGYAERYCGEYSTEKCDCWKRIEGPSFHRGLSE